jgi:P22 coat protein - gene protein 5
VGNTILTPQIITNELLRRFENNLGFAKVVHHEDYSEHFGKPGAKVGDTISLRDPVRFAATDGATLVVQDVEERKIPLVINTRKHTAFSFTSAEQTLSIDRIGERYIEGAAVALANAAEVSGLTLAYQQTPNLVGTPGAGAPNGTTAFSIYLSATEALDRNSAPMDGERYVCIGPKFQTPIVDALKGLFQSTEQIKRQYIKGRMGTAASFEWLMAQNLRTQIWGSIAGGVSIVVNGAGQSGSSLNITGMTANAVGVFNPGDTFTIGSGGTLVYAVNAVSGDTLSDPRQFTILNTVNADGSGNGVANIYPPISVLGDTQHPNPYATCSQSPANSATINPTCTTGGTLSPQALAFHKEAYAWACVPLDLPRAVEMAKRATNPDTGVSIRTVAQYDVVNDIFVTRCDIMYGWVAPRKDWGCRIAA